MIVKVQIPLFSTDPNVGCLVYPQQRRKMVEQSITKATHKALAGDNKGYFNAEWNAKTQCYDIADRVAEQAW
ncbi:MAG TPA: hypothetical protein VLZ84_07150 [Asticcacaulis sp.]|nr:hypothetical protein [Asticcacaulis sp.]